MAVNPDSTHVVVLDNNQMYFFQALWPDGTVAVNEEDILQILLAIRADASKVAPEVSSRNALGVSSPSLHLLLSVFVHMIILPPHVIIIIIQ